MTDTIELAPHSIEAEENLLGSILLNGEIMEYLNGFLEPNDFFLTKHTWVYEAMLDLHKRGLVIDYVTLTDALTNAKRLNEIGGAGFLMQLLNNTVTHTHFMSYSHIVFEKALKRHILKYASESAQIASKPNLDVFTSLDEINAKLTALNARLGQFENPTDDSAGHIAELIVDDVVEGIPAQMYKTGLTVLDHALDGGIERGKFLVVAGFTGHGKTQLKKQIALNMAIQKQDDVGRRLRVLYIALEGSAKDITRRMLSQMTGYNTSYFKNALVPPNPNCPMCNGSGTRQDNQNQCDCHLHYGKIYHQALFKATDKLKNRYDIDIVAGNQSVGSTKRLVLRKMRERLRDLVVVDYLQKVETAGYNSKREAVSAYADLMPWVAIEFNCVVMAGSQFNRENTINTNRQKEIIPQVNDLAESSQIEKNADYVISPVRAYDDVGELTNETKLWYLKVRDTAPKPYSPLVFVPNRSSFGLKDFGV